MPEVIQVLTRCKTCGGATRVLLGHTYMTMAGAMVYAEWAEAVEHKRSDCERLVTLTREAWPTLW